jgi:hypothetical protein
MPWQDTDFAVGRQKDDLVCLPLEKEFIRGDNLDVKFSAVHILFLLHA